MTREIEALAHGAQVRSIGIGCPGPVDPAQGMIVNATNMPGWQQVPLRDMLAARSGIPVKLDHDAKVAAQGELHFGAGRGLRNMVYCIVGSGVGAAIVVDGQVFRGEHNMAGEFGHITLNLDGDPDAASGVRGSVQSFMCGPELAAEYARRGGRADANSGEAVAAAATHGDTIALQVMHRAGCALGAAIGTLAMVLDIRTFVVGGSVARSGELLLAPARSALADYAFKAVAARTHIVQSNLFETAPILGAAFL
jgi:glucokinase